MNNDQLLINNNQLTIVNCKYYIRHIEFVSYLLGLIRYKTFIIYLILLIVSSQAGFAQNYINPQAMALGDAYSSVARGYFSVGYNPANLAFPSKYKTYINLAGLNYIVTNNFVSLKTNAKYGGKDITANGEKLQKELISEIPNKGWRYNSGVNIPLPLLNFSTGNKALTANFLYITDYYFSKPALEILFGGMEKDTEYNLDLRCDAMTAIEYAYSMGIPYNNMALGFSLKYIQGLGYYGLDPKRSSGTVSVDTILSGLGDYFFREAYGGRGFAIDLGIAFQELNGWNMGISVSNFAALMKWNYNTLFSDIVGTSMLKFMGGRLKSGNPDIDLDFEGESYNYSFLINDVSGEEFFQGDSNFSNLFFSAGVIDTTDTSLFKVRLPLVLRLGLSKQVKKDILLVTDLTASFGDRLNYWKGWRCSLGMEYSYLPSFPLRLGVSFGGLSGWEINIGSGINAGFIHFDWAVGFHRGLWLHTARGINFSMGAYLTRKTKSLK